MTPAAATAALVASVVAVFLPAGAAASSWDLHGFGPRGAALAGAVAAATDDFTAVYYNPAALAARLEPQAGASLDLVLPALSMDFDRADPTPAPKVVRRGLALDLGLSVPVPARGATGRRIALGLGVFHPVLGGTRIGAFDPVRPQLWLYQSLPDKVILAPAVGVELAPWLLVGGGLQILAFIEGEADTAVSLGARRFTRTGIRVDILGNTAPTAGLLLRPHPRLRLGLSYRHALEFSYDLPLRLLIEEVGTLELDMRGVALYTPHQADAGLWWRAADDLAFLAGVTYAAWGATPDPAADVVIRLGGESLGRGELVRLQSTPADLGAADIWIPRCAAEWTPAGPWTWRAGVHYRPTPLPPPTERTNYADAPAITASLGASLRGAGDAQGPARAGSYEGALQISWLLPRRIDKRDPADPVGGYDVGGAVVRLSIGVRRDL